MLIRLTPADECDRADHRSCVFCVQVELFAHRVERYFDIFDDWIALDLRYIDQWSLWLDLQILVRTIPAVLRGTGAA